MADGWIEDPVCRHGVALDVHCCHCHSGFVFDRDHECPPSPRSVYHAIDCRCVPAGRGVAAAEG